MVGGVLAGVARYLNVDPTVIRVLFAVAVVVTGGCALLLYPALWFLMPQEGAAPTTGWTPPWNPAQPTPAQPTPAQPTPAQPTPAQPTPAQPTPAQPTPSAPREPDPADPSTWPPA
jgi:phage shock protein C